MAFTNLEKTHMVLIHGQARRHSKLARQIYGERFPQKILPNARTLINVVQHLRDFGRFEMNKHDLSRQREDRILVPQEIFHEIKNQLRASTRRRLANPLGVSQFVVWLRVQNATQEIRQNRGIVKLFWFSWARRAEACIVNDGKHFEQLLSCFILCFFTRNYSLFTLLFSE
jgi:hypothetical protein